MSIALIILAAGKGTRMKSDLPKVLHHIAGAPMLVHAMKSGATLDPAKTIIVAGHGAEQVSDAAKAFDETADVVLQTEQLGTAHAVAQAKEVLFDFDGDALVLYGDTPFINPKTLEHMTAARSDHDVVVLGFEAADPGRYGRLIMEGEHLKKIVEFKDASDEERQITLCNSGVICAKSAILFDLIAAVGNDNASGEYYLTDIVEIAQRKGLNATSVTCDESETLGVNSRVQLAEADAIFQSKARVALMEAGVTLHAPDTVYLSHDTHIGPDTIIEPNVVFGASVTVENGANIRAFSHLEGCHVSRGATVGPYARLRPGTELAEFTRVGNFVEIKNAVIDEGAKVNHLSYVGDAHVGARANIGAGTITCNYDGVMKHHTEIGEDSFIGSNTLLVAPVAIGANAMTASGTVVTQDVPDDALAIARSKQINKTGLAVKLFDMLKKKKNNSKKEVL
ncbi:MAG TPA: bifunctional UDP-N-acetylglucosamine diphosphorylase/glucosamine-1-phosphate N-acetyltransferase GlmU [Rhodobacteraceae bacterium]|jgi:bifunctional UDP-N-acetylglucosamine pyrophosphorylase/glucosamine-1-phosphate N-acetyltransferase|uniref:bifunctional UDP-N-acetylglucosamine diphosphorylase/glucosamine-1-phosphate N-acetyltransferase GlmU n=1 Tax=Planktotalea sp. TaxID=2029877 RepID=UPI000183A997|nr:bifunctional UDP-N-acetylglucosamine diphosphorylase/glucosamine-1-phosphate N-acetyltransferase GlmU [Planktotalea sp.]EDZ42020.1 UDP-N-acetylglucosamine diphosphorylase/glucosamine-1-phosphate N-acetyltransferase [Rhodobacteraceae bacterium HTCC2083]MDG1083650.1 bifunctional UDP-N-acetylglucosamine diphosphorylase/glucosamine-1-phosphate N-acetyltransferase GlmU [Planktotalea sp.]HCW85246.1 bifunctional UDP-N-acetylglucosamine diphosphorylase/glucosamine-1-phosphate N-acetyltransferase GlmU